MIRYRHGLFPIHATLMLDYQQRRFRNWAQRLSCNELISLKCDTIFPLLPFPFSTWASTVWFHFLNIFQAGIFPVLINVELLQSINRLLYNNEGFTLYWVCTEAVGWFHKFTFNLLEDCGPPTDSCFDSKKRSAKKLFVHSSQVPRVHNAFNSSMPFSHRI